VVNQIHEDTDVTEFNGMKDLPPGEFTDVFGDSFISGFVTGGEFNAIVSFKVKDKSKLRTIKAAAEISLNNVPGLELKAKGAVSMDDLKAENEAESSISVSWMGGGDVKDDSIHEWNIENLKKAAVEFPDRVQRTPQRTQ
jgi:hypothetical protein